MSRRGQIIVECDSPKCHAEIIFEAKDVAAQGLVDRLILAGWKRRGLADTCPQCAEGK